MGEKNDGSEYPPFLERPPLLLALSRVVFGPRCHVKTGSRVAVNAPLVHMHGHGTIVEYSADPERGAGTHLYPVYRVHLDDGQEAWVYRDSFRVLRRRWRDQKVD